jgi:hypothetical protein
MRVTPSLPYRRRKPKGNIPLDPSFFGVIFSTFSGVIAILGDARAAGGEARCKKEPPGAIDCCYEGFNKAFFGTFPQEITSPQRYS